MQEQRPAVWSNTLAEAGIGPISADRSHAVAATQMLSAAAFLRCLLSGFSVSCFGSLGTNSSFSPKFFSQSARSIIASEIRRLIVISAVCSIAIASVLTAGNHRVGFILEAGVLVFLILSAGSLIWVALATASSLGYLPSQRRNRAAFVIGSERCASEHQIANVLRGEMSLVRPCPLTIRDVKNWLLYRSSVLPRLTGLWQVDGRSIAEFPDCIRLDLKYIGRWSVALGTKIFCETVPAVLRGSGAM